MEYSLDHEDSMEVQMVEFVHALTKKARDVKRSYGKKINNPFKSGTFVGCSFV